MNIPTAIVGDVWYLCLVRYLTSTILHEYSTAIVGDCMVPLFSESVLPTIAVDEYSCSIVEVRYLFTKQRYHTVTHDSGRGYS